MSEALQLETKRLSLDEPAIVSPENAASVALIEKLGLQFERMHRLPGDDDDVAIYGTKLDWSVRA